MKCPKCVNPENPRQSLSPRSQCPECGSNLMVPHSCKTKELENGQTNILCVNCGAYISSFHHHEEKVKTDEK